MLCLSSFLFRVLVGQVLVLVLVLAGLVLVLVLVLVALILVLVLVLVGPVLVNITAIFLIKLNCDQNLENSCIPR